MGIYNAAPNKTDKYNQGIFPIKNSSKYMGNEEKCFYRSSYELKFMVYCDNSPNIVKWGAEMIAVPYFDWDGKEHKYYIDFIVEDIKGEKWLIEVKPLAESLLVLNNEVPPPPKKESSKALENYEYTLKQWALNRHKWAQARQYAEDRGYKFKIVTEETLNKTDINM
jgi:hypothetical protein